MLDFTKEVDPIDGWLTRKEALLLYELAKKVDPNISIVEIGSWQGKSTICLARGTQEGGKTKVYAVDPHTGSSEHRKKFGSINTYDRFRSNLINAKIGSYVQPLVMNSEKAAQSFTDKVGLVFIDGAHEFSLVKKDFSLWFPFVINGGYVAFHDSWHRLGPRLVTAFIIALSSRVKKPRLIDTITYFEKVEKNSLGDRFKNMYFLFFRFLYSLTGLTNKDIRRIIFRTITKRRVAHILNS